jgi:predicted DsbA family dithiol-disulfide isomerase
VTALAAEEGLQYHFDRARPGNSFDAHRLLHLAKHHDLQSEMKERLQKSYFTDGLSFSDPEMLVQLAAEVGLDADKTREMLLSDIFTAEVHGDIHRARMLGINGVPFFLFDQKYAVSGAQPTELFMTALQRSWADSQPVVKTLNMGENADMSDNENCVV